MEIQVRTSLRGLEERAFTPRFPPLAQGLRPDASRRNGPRGGRETQGFRTASAASRCGRDSRTLQVRTGYLPGDLNLDGVVSTNQ